MSIFPTKILLATDGSKEAELAARTAADLAQKTGSELHLVHVFGIAPCYPIYPEATDPGGVELENPVLEEELENLSEQRAREILDTEVEKVRSAGGTVAQAHLKEGGVPYEIVALAEDLGVGLIVVGSRGRVKRALASDKTLTQTKSSKGRGVRLTSVAVDALKGHRERQAGERAKLNGLWRESGLVFTSRVGTPLDPDNFIHRSFKPLFRRAGLPEMRFHDLRHTFATLMLSNGEHPKIVPEVLGHAQISLTLDTYSHVLPSMQDGAVGRFGELLS